MIVRYQPNENDEKIIGDITANVRKSLEGWYGIRSSLDSDVPEIRSYRNSFILRYPITTSSAQNKHILVKIRRNPKMDSLSQAVHADIHHNIPREYKSLQYVFNHLSNRDENFGAIRPLAYMERYSAIVMEEYPSRTLRQLLNNQRSSKADKAIGELIDAARKTGRWLHYFHQHIHVPTEKPYTTADILLEVQAYAERLESSSRGRVRAHLLLDAFSKKLENISIERVIFSKSHADMTCDNVLYSEDQRVCIIDIKTRLAPIYADLGLILIHPETSKLQILTGGTYYPESLLREYRAQIIAGYFDEEPGNEVMVRIYAAIQVLNKWLMYEEIMNRYRGVKHILSLPVAPFVAAYFQTLLKKHLELIGEPEPGQALQEKGAADTVV